MAQEKKTSALDAWREFIAWHRAHPNTRWPQSSATDRERIETAFAALERKLTDEASACAAWRAFALGQHYATAQFRPMMDARLRTRRGSFIGATRQHGSVAERKARRQQ